MPCTVSREEQKHYERSENKKIYGVSELGGRIATRVACELVDLIAEAGLEKNLSPIAKKWIENHKREDEGII